LTLRSSILRPMRAPKTPSGAAELISSHFVKAAERAMNADAAMTAAVAGALGRSRERLAHAASRLRLLTPTALVERGYLRLDDLSNQLRAALRSAVQGRRTRLDRIAGRLERVSPEARIRLGAQRLELLGKRLRAASPASVLNRGFAILYDEAGRP